VYFAASVDSADINRRFAESLGLPYPVLSDPTKGVARAYGVLATSGYASRWTFLIGADGRILDIDKTVKASTHGADVEQRVQSSEFRVQGSGSSSGSGSDSGLGSGSSSEHEA
jgi:thioredoxin-dependent peroxiredoxin